jgi:hypothetical protein
MPMEDDEPRAMRGIARRLDAARLPGRVVRRLAAATPPGGGDVAFSPDYAVTSTTDGGGRLLTHVEVVLCFWGSFWRTHPPPAPSRDDYETAIEGIVTGPYMSGLGQYRGIGPGTLIYSEINDGTDPVDGYTDADVVNMLTARLQAGAMPPPIAGHDRLYVVILPVGVSNALTQYVGQHQSFVYNGVTGYYAWVGNTGSLTGHNCVTKVFSHELADACTNPNVDTSNDGILVSGAGVANDEIADTCNNQFTTITVNGLSCSLQSYWSKADNACILPALALPTLNFQGLWWNAPANSEPYWGISFSHQGDQVFAIWYTYNSAGEPWWLSLLANRTSPASYVYTGTIYQNTGPPFNAYAGNPFPHIAGTGTLSFSDAGNGTFTYGILGVTQTKPIVRLDLGTGAQPSCTYSGTPNLAAATNYQDLWWAAGGSEPGWGINVAHQGDSIFATWYTYDAGGMATWLSMLAQRIGTSSVYSGPLYRTSGPRFDAYDPTKAVPVQVGTASLTFADGNHATFAYTTTGAAGLPAVTQSKQISRFQYATVGGTVCQ